MFGLILHLIASFHPLKSGRNTNFISIRICLRPVSIPSSRVGTRQAILDEVRNEPFPSPQVGSEPEIAAAYQFAIAQFPSPQVGSELGTCFLLHRLGSVSIPSSRVGTSVTVAKSCQLFRVSIPSSRVGTSKQNNLSMIHNEVSIPSSRVGTS